METIKAKIINGKADIELYGQHFIIDEKEFSPEGEYKLVAFATTYLVKASNAMKKTLKVDLGEEGLEFIEVDIKKGKKK